MRDLERLLQLSCESARVMCSHMDSLGSGLYELGRNMGMLSKVRGFVVDSQAVLLNGC